jgi:hypothetical protein
VFIKIWALILSGILLYWAYAILNGDLHQALGALVVLFIILGVGCLIGLAWT